MKGLRNARIALRTALALVAALGLFAVAPAYAEQDPVKANKLFTDAREKLKDDDREGALELLDQAENYFAHPAILLLKAKTQRELGLLEAADGTLDRVDTSKLPRPLRKVHGEERAEIEKARKEMGHLIVRVTPSDALVVVDKHEHRGGYDRWRPVGDTRVEVIAPGHQPTVRTATIAAAGKVELEIALAPLRGAIRVTVPGGLKGVDVLVDGKSIEIEEARRAGEVHRIETGLGKHEVVCRRGSREVGRVVEVAFGGEVQVRCDGVEPKADVARLSLGWGGVAAGAALATYGVWGIQSYFADQEKAKSEGLIAESNKHYGGAAYLVSGLAVGLASYWLLLRDPGEPSANATASLLPSSEAGSGAVSALAPLH